MADRASSERPGEGPPGVAPLPPFDQKTSPRSPSSGSLSGRRLLERLDEAAPLLERSNTLQRTFSRVVHTSADAEVPGPRSLGRLLAERLVALGVTHFFGVPGDFNLALLDELIAEPRLQMISCCNELNAGYAAEGYARAKGLAALVTTFSVGGLSALNAVAGAYAEDQPVVCIVGAPYSTAWSLPRVLHHTLGKAGQLDFELECFRPVTCYQAQLRRVDTPAEMVRKLYLALRAAVEQRKPVYISIPSDFAAMQHAAFAQAVPPPPPALVSVPSRLEAAVARVADFLNRATKPVLVAGAHMRSARARAAMVALAEASGMPVAVMLNSKGLFPEDHPNCIGLFWSSLSSPGTGEIVVSADAYCMVGPVFTDVSTAGYTHMIAPSALVEVQRDAVLVGTSGLYGLVAMEDFLEALIPRVKRNSRALDKWRAQHVPPGVPPPLPSGTPLAVNRVFKHLQAVLDSSHALVVDIGDGLYFASKLRLPHGCPFEIQACYASIGWSLGATLGYGIAEPQRRVVTVVGDGAAQMTAQELSTIMRYGVNPIVLLSNNGSYTIESEIHDGPYNRIQQWDWCKVAQGMDVSGNLRAFKVTTEEEVAAALQEAVQLKANTVLIECILDPGDCSVEVLTMGKLMANTNAGVKS